MAKKTTYDAESITILEGLEAVRKRPGMYIGSVSTKGLNHLVYEIVDNAVDEHLAGFCSQIEVTLEKDGSATVTDNGRGVPVGMHAKGVSAARIVYTTLHAGGKFDDSAYKTSGGLHGVGSSVVNALSTYMDVKISRDGAVHHDRYERGIPVVELEDGLLPVIGKTKKTGTCVNFLPDPTIFEKTRFKEEEIKSRLHETAYLNPELTIIFTDKRKTQEERIEYHEPDGIIGFIKDLNSKKEVIHDPVYYKGEAEGIEVEVAFQYVNEFHENVLGFCNNIYNAEGGTHLTGFKTTFTTIMNQYAREIGVLKDKDANFTGADVRNGMTAIVSIKHPDPRFEGQTKTKLDNQDAAKATGKVTSDEIPRFFDRNLETLKKVLSCAEKAAKIRKTEERAKTNLLTKQKYSFEQRRMVLMKHHNSMWINIFNSTSAYYYALIGRVEKIPEIFGEHRLFAVNFLAPGRPMMEMIENQVYLAQGAYAKVIGRSEGILAVCSAMHYALVALHVQIQTAAAYERIGKHGEARTILKQALSDASKDHMVMPFVENFIYLSSLFEGKFPEIDQEFLAKILSLGKAYEENCKKMGKEKSYPEQFKCLTEQELKLTELMAAHMSNKEIAARLYLSEGTVKQYINQIYSKLEITGDTRTKRKQLLEQFYTNN